MNWGCKIVMFLQEWGRFLYKEKLEYAGIPWVFTRISWSTNLGGFGTRERLYIFFDWICSGCKILKF